VIEKENISDQKLRMYVGRATGILSSRELDSVLSLLRKLMTPSSRLKLIMQSDTSSVSRS